MKGYEKLVLFIFIFVSQYVQLMPSLFNSTQIFGNF